MVAGDITQGQRIEGSDPYHWPEGGYGLFHGHWYGKAPGGELGNLSGHDLTEHEDGTLTVAPSILISTRRGGQDVQLWHGYLERGVWREV